LLDVVRCTLSTIGQRKHHVAVNDRNRSHHHDMDEDLLNNFKRRLYQL